MLITPALTKMKMMSLRVIKELVDDIILLDIILLNISSPSSMYFHSALNM